MYDAEDTAIPVAAKPDVPGYTPPAPLPHTLSLAIAYVPFQQNSDMMAAEEGFAKGTVFTGLYKPFTGKRGVLE